MNPSVGLLLAAALYPVSGQPMRKELDRELYKFSEFFQQGPHDYVMHVYLL